MCVCVCECVDYNQQVTVGRHFPQGVYNPDATPSLKTRLVSFVFALKPDHNMQVRLKTLPKPNEM